MISSFTFFPKFFQNNLALVILTSNLQSISNSLYRTFHSFYLQFYHSKFGKIK